MGYDPEPPPGLSELEDRHQLQWHARSIGYVAVPEALWERIEAALLFYPASIALLADIRVQQEVIERELS